MLNTRVDRGQSTEKSRMKIFLVSPNDFIFNSIKKILIVRTSQKLLKIKIISNVYISLVRYVYT